MKNFYLLGWDNRNWIAYSTDKDNLYDDKKIIISHDVFAVGSDEDFIIVKQHPCENGKAHFMDYDGLKPNSAITNYYIIDTRGKNNFKVHQFSGENEFNDWRNRLGVSKNLNFRVVNDIIE